MDLVLLSSSLCLFPRLRDTISLNIFSLFFFSLTFQLMKGRKVGSMLKEVVKVLMR